MRNLVILGYVEHIQCCTTNISGLAYSNRLLSMLVGVMYVIEFDQASTLCEQQSPPPFNCILVRVGDHVPHSKLNILICKYTCNSIGVGEMVCITPYYYTMWAFTNACLPYNVTPQKKKIESFLTPSLITLFFLNQRIPLPPAWPSHALKVSLSSTSRAFHFQRSPSLRPCLLQRATRPASCRNVGEMVNHCNWPKRWVASGCWCSPNIHQPHLHPGLQVQLPPSSPSTPSPLP